MKTLIQIAEQIRDRAKETKHQVAKLSETIDELGPRCRRASRVDDHNKGRRLMDDPMIQRELALDMGWGE